MNSRKNFGLAALAGLTALAACDPGLVEAIFHFEPGAAPSYPPELNATIVAWAEERVDPHRPGPELNARSTTTYSLDPFPIDDVPYGRNRMIAVEIHVGNRIAHYAFSELFEIHRGDHLLVPIRVQPTSPPQGLPPELGASLAIATSSLAPGYVNHPRVELELYAEERATKVRLSNHVGLPEEKSITVELSALEPIEGTPAPDGFRGYRYEGWNLDQHVELCVDDNRCPREVLGQFIDAYGYAGMPVRGSVILDRRAPIVLEALTDISPTVADENSRVVVSLTASEPIAVPELSIAQNVDFPFELVSPNDGVPSATYIFTSSRAAGSIERDGTFLIRANLRDVAGNRARAVDVGTFSVDTVAPVIDDVRVEPARINGQPGRAVEVRFRLNKIAHYAVTIDGRAVDRCVERGRAPAIELVCERAMRGDELPAGAEKTVAVSIDVTDDAGHAASAGDNLVFDFKPPSVYAVAFTPEATGAGDRAQLYLASDEPLEEGHLPVLAFNGPTPPFLHAPDRATDFERFFELDDTTNLAPGEYQLASVTLRDTAQNEATTALSERWLYDPVSPVIDDLRVTVRGGAPVIPPRVPHVAGTLIDVAFTVREEHPSEERVMLFEDDLRSACAISGSTPVRAISCTYISTGLEVPPGGERGATLTVEVADRAGNRSLEAATIIFDYRPPDLVAGSASLQLSPSADNWLRRIPGPAAAVERVGLGTHARLSVVIDEPVREPPIISTSPSALSFALTQASGTSFTYEHTLNAAPLAQGLILFEMTAVDIAGNIATRPVALPAPGMWIDTVPPPAPNTLRMTHRRYPWGSDATGDGPAASVEAEGGAVEANAIVAVSAARELTSFDLLGHTRADAQGGVAPFFLDRTEDHAEVYAVIIDAAGNPSASTSGAPDTASRIRRGETTASLRGKVPGRETPNPHEARIARALVPTLEQEPDMIQELDATQYAALAASDGDPLAATTIRRWEHVQLSLVQPSARIRAAMAYDTMLGRGVMFGGYGLRTPMSPQPEPLDDTYEWDGQRWTLVAPVGPRPSARNSHTMAYHALIGRVVLFGGCGPLMPRNNETWLYDGTAWREVPNAAPAALTPRCGPAMTYDSDRGAVLLFGGSEASGTARNDLWSFDGASWTLLDAGTPGGPSARSDASLIFVPGAGTAPGRAMLAGGTSNGVDPLAGAWAWDGARWSSIATSLPARLGAAYVYDPVSARRVFFGGLGAGAASDELWVDNTRYSAPFDFPLPTARAFAASAYDLRRGHAIFFGGGDAFGNASAETWAFTGDRLGEGWRNVTPSPLRPSARADHAMAYDPAARQMVMFGGRDALTGVLGETWLWNGTRWDRHPVDLPARERHAMARDGDVAGVSSCVLLFGGEDGAPIADTRLWFVQNWTTFACGSTASTAGPSARPDPAMASAGLTTILFGGGTRFAPLGDTWERSGLMNRVWTQRSVAGPPARFDHAMAARGAQLVLYGGASSAPAPFGDLWEWSPSTAQWQQRSLSGAQPGARSKHAMAEDMHRGRAVLFGGIDEREVLLEDTWEWDGTAWVEIETQAHPPARADHALAYDPDRHRLVLFGGRDLEDTLLPADVWELHADPAQRPGIELAFDWLALRIEPAAVRTAELRAIAGGRAYNDAAVVSGAELAAWNARAGRWESFDANGGDINAPAALGRSFSSAAELRAHLTWDEHLRLLLRPRAGLGDFGTAGVVAEGVELSVRYELTD